MKPLVAALINGTVMLAASTTAADAVATESPVVLGATGSADLWQNTRGGVARDHRDLQLLTLTADLDTEKAWEHPGGSAHISALIHRNTFADVTGEAQTLSNIDFGDGEQLFEAWYQQQHGEAGSSLLFGLYDLNSEFDHIETAGLFINSSHGIGKDFSQSGINGPSIAPLSSLAVRGQWLADAHWTLRLAVLDGVPGESGGKNIHNSIHLDAADGTLVAAEAIYSPTEEQHFAAGTWRYTRELPAFLPAGAPGQATSQGAYFFVDTPLPGSEGDWRAFLRAGLADDDTNAFGRYTGAGLVWQGKLWRSDDRLGASIADVRSGDAWRSEQDALGTPVGPGETVIELTYLTQATGWLTLQPDVQYVIHPGADPALTNALAVGVRLKFSLETD